MLRIRRPTFILTLALAAAALTASLVRTPVSVPSGSAWAASETARAEGEAAESDDSAPKKSEKNTAKKDSGDSSSSDSPTPLYAGKDAVRLKEFEHTLYDSDNKPDGTITGGLAFWDQEMYEVISPVVVSRVRQKQKKEEKGDDKKKETVVHEVKLQADRATLLEGKGTVRLYGDVDVRGKEFHITTQDVTYFTSGDRMKSKSPIEVTKYRVTEEGKKKPTLRIRGSDSSADLTLKKITIRKNPVMKILEASEDFLASGEKKNKDGGNITVTVKADEKLIYDHPARKATFVGDVKVTGGGKTLRCQKLDISIQKGDGGGPSVTGIRAEGRVWLRYAELTAMGKRLKWQNVTQTCELHGENATIKTRQFDLSGSHLTFFRLNNRFNVDGPGQLTWKTESDDTSREKSGREGSTGALLDTSGEGETDITWKKGMTYDKSEQWAIFKGDVSARQSETSLSGQTLELQFDSNRQVKKGAARGAARLVKKRPESGDILFRCEEMSWIPGKGTLRLESPKDQKVHVETPRQRLSAGQVVFEQKTGALRCPSSGSMSVKRSGKKEASSAPNVSVRWQNSMEYHRSSPARAFFKGDVRSSVGGRKVRARRLGVKFDENMKPVEVVASGDARLLSADTASSEGAGEKDNEDTPDKDSSGSTLGLPQAGSGGENWELRSSEFTIHPQERTLDADSAGSITMTGKKKKQAGAKRIEWSDRMQYDGKKGSAVFEGEVKAHMLGRKLVSDTLNADFSESGGLRYMRARGNVSVSGGESASWHLTSDSAEAIFEGNSRLREVIARTNVEITDRRGRLTAELLHLFFEKTGKKNQTPQLSRGVAQKDVFVKRKTSPEFTARGDKLTWDYGENRYVLTGSPYARVIRENTRARYEKLIIDRKTGEVKAPKGSRPSEIQIIPGRSPKD